MNRDSASLKSFLMVFVGACLFGGLAGIAGAWLDNVYQVIPRLERLSDQVAHLGTVVTSTPATPTPAPVVVVPVESRPLSPAFPPAFVDRRNSAVLELVKRGKGDGEPVARERVFGEAVAVTSDGWLATAGSAIDGMRLADIAVGVGGHVRAVERGVRDLSTGIAYLKISATDLPTPAFVRASDVVAGAPVWRESAPLSLAPELVVSLHAPQAEPVSSERAGRRFLATAPSDATPGSAIWDGSGRLVGILEAADEAGAWRVLPSAPIGSALGQFLQNGSIQRASLGVRSYDLSSVTVDAPSSTLPSLGAWLHADRKTGAVAVNAKGVAAKSLRDGDVIERIERDILDGSADLGERLLDYRPGVAVNLTVSRKGEEMQIPVTLGTETVSETIK